MQWLMSRPNEILPKRLSYPGWLEKAIYMISEDNYFTPASIIDVEKDLSHNTINKIRKSFIDNYIQSSI